MGQNTHAGTAMFPILFGAFSSKLATERVLQGSSWPFVKKTWVGFMSHPPYASLRTWTLGSEGTAPSGKESKHPCWNVAWVENCDWMLLLLLLLLLLFGLAPWKKPICTGVIRSSYRFTVGKGEIIPNSVQYWYCHESESASPVSGGPAMAKVSGLVSAIPAKKASKATVTLKRAAKPSE